MSKFTLDRTPTLLPVMTAEKVGRCALCGKPVYADEEVTVLDASGAVIHENCMIFTKLSLAEALDLLGLDYYTGTAREMVENV